MMEHVKLQHPLPDEIRKMDRDETVCKFCGVSYLIHNEIKALEDKLRAAEAELVIFRGIEGREEKLKQQVTELEKEIQKLRTDIISRDTIIETLRNDVTCRDEMIAQFQQEDIKSKKDISVLKHDWETSNLRHSLLAKSLPKVIQQLHNHKSESLSIKNLVAAQNTVFREECRLLQDKVNQVIMAKLSDLTSIQSRLSELERSTQGQEKKESELQTQLLKAQMQIQQLSTAAHENSQLQQELQKIKEQLKISENSLHELSEKNRKLSLEAEQSNTKIRNLTNELSQLDGANTQLRKRTSEDENKLIRLQQEAVHLTDQLDSARRQVEQIRGEYEEQQEKLKRTTSASTMEKEDLHEAINKLSRDMTALKSEREMMILAHQNQIEQLRESFKSRILEADKWPQRMEETLSKERKKHANELQALEDKLKESFIMELHIEKQKHQELLHKYHNDNRLDEQQVKSQLDKLHTEYKSEITDLHKQLAEYKARSRNIENSLRDEITNLKKIIRDLEDRLGRVDVTADTQVRELQGQVHKLRAELEDSKRDVSKKQQLLNTAKEEIAFLQETVRKECEERFELTEALSQTKEELLSYKRPSGGFVPSQAWAPSSRSGSTTSLSNSKEQQPIKSQATHISTTRSEEIAIYKKLASNRPQPPSQPRDSSPDTKEAVPGNNLSMEVQKSDRTPPGRGLKGASLTESRKRISNILGRK